ncbi:MAG: hypothetical protein GX483_01260 [Actinomycetaceae bacterium]|nr:hypothetical protein [Actinomycetaceae bacterium]
MGRWLDGILDIVYPRACAGCGAWDETLCAACASELTGALRRVESGAPYLMNIAPDGTTYPAFPVWAIAEYRGTVAQVIVHWKNTHDRRLDQIMAGIFERACAELVRGSAPEAETPLSPVASLSPVALGNDPAELVVLPVPSQGSRRRDGRFVTGVLARVAARAVGGRYLDVLRMTPERGLLGRLMAFWREKRRGAIGQTGVRARASKADLVYSRRDLSASRVLLIDDVLTSGATLAGAARAIAQAGGSVVGAVVFATTAHP